MKLAHAVRVAKTVEVGKVLTSEQKIAVHVLTELGQRLVASRPILRTLWKAVGGEEELNQMSLGEQISDVVGKVADQISLHEKKDDEPA